MSEFEILGRKILKGESKIIDLELAKLHTRTPLKVPLIIERSKYSGPVVLLMAGIHGDEVNGVAIVRELISMGLNKPRKGVIICIPVFNVFGYLIMQREFPDGKDLNRVFPGRKSGSLASQFAYTFTKEIAPLVDYVIDFHTGGGERDNAPQIRCRFEDDQAVKLAKIFRAPFLVNSKNIKNSVRETLNKLDKTILLYEGGRSNFIDPDVVNKGVQGTIRVLRSLGVLKNVEAEKTKPSILVQESTWIRAPYSGMFRPNVDNGAKVYHHQVIGSICDPYGEFERPVKAPLDGFVFCVNRSPIVNKGNALFHISKSIGKVPKIKA